MAGQLILNSMDRRSIPNNDPMSSSSGEQSGGRKRLHRSEDDDKESQKEEADRSHGRRRIEMSPSISSNEGSPRLDRIDASFPPQERALVQRQATLAARGPNPANSTASADLAESVDLAALSSPSVNGANALTGLPEVQALLMQQAASLPLSNTGKRPPAASGIDPSVLLLLEQQRRRRQREQLIIERLALRGLDSILANETLPGDRQNSLNGIGGIGNQHRPDARMDDMRIQQMAVAAALSGLPVPGGGGGPFGLPAGMNPLLLNHFLQAQANKASRGGQGDNVEARLRAQAALGAMNSPMVVASAPPPFPAADPSSFSGNMHPPVDLYMACDEEVLSDHQVLLRQQIQFFEATPNDILAMPPGRRRDITIGQVGIRCRHCALLPVHLRPRGSMYFPSTLRALYQAAQNMAVSHFCAACEQVSEPVKRRLQEYQEAKATAGHGGKKYWADGARARGVIETEDKGLRFVSSKQE